MMKRVIVLLFVVLAACSSESSREKENTPLKKNDYSRDEQPVKTVVDFIRWYADHNCSIGVGMVNNADGKDSTKFYSVNFFQTEKYLSDLKSSGFISGKYLEKWRSYFKKCDEDFSANPSNEGPPEGFDYDFVMLSQDYEDDLKNAANLNVIASSVSGDHASVEVEYIGSGRLQYVMSRNGDKWEIDDIKRE